MKKIFAAVIALLLAICVMLVFPVNTAAITYSDEGNVSFVLLGDSIADGIGASNTPYSQYGNIVTRHFGYTLLNDAVSGDKTGDLTKLIKNNKSVAAHIKTADIVAISIGGNNAIGMNYAAMLQMVTQGSKGKRAKDLLDDIYSEFINIKQLIRSINSECVIYLQTIYNPLHNTDNPLFSMAENFAVDFTNDVAELVKKACDTDERMFCVDIHNVFEQHYMSTGETDYVFTDWIHPSVKGNAAIADEYINIMDEQQKSGILPQTHDNFTYGSMYDMNNLDNKMISARYSDSAVNFDGGNIVFSGEADREDDGVVFDVKIPENAVGVEFTIKAESTDKFGVVCAKDSFDSENVFADTTECFRVANDRDEYEIKVFFNDNLISPKFTKSDVNKLLLKCSTGGSFKVTDFSYIISDVQVALTTEQTTVNK